MAKGILITLGDFAFVDVKIEEDGSSLKDMYKYVEADLLDVVSIENNIDLWVDDEGLLKSGNFVQEYKVGDSDGMALAGNVLILSSNEDGETLGLNQEQIDYLVDKLHFIPVGIVR